MSNSIQKTESRKQVFLQYNMNIFDIMIRYVILMILVIIGGALRSIPIMLLGLPFFWSAILGWSPIFYLLGINHHDSNNG
jgi:fatty acid desaturase